MFQRKNLNKNYKNLRLRRHNHMYWPTEDHHQPNYYSNFQIVQHQNGIPQTTAAVPPQQQQQQQLSTPPPPLPQQQQHQQQQQQQQMSHRIPHQQITQNYPTNQQLQHQHHQWPTRPPILTAPPFFQQIRTTVPSSAQYCTAPPPYFNQRRGTQTPSVSAPSQQRSCIPPGSAMYSMPPPQTAALRQNIIAQPPAATSTKSSGQQMQVQYFSPSQYCQPPLTQPSYGHTMPPAVPDIPVVKHRKHAIPIIDPRTKENILERELRSSKSASPADEQLPTVVSPPTSGTLKVSQSNLSADLEISPKEAKQEKHQNIEIGEDTADASVQPPAILHSVEPSTSKEDGDDEGNSTPTIIVTTKIVESQSYTAEERCPPAMGAIQKPPTLFKAVSSKANRLQYIQKQPAPTTKAPSRKSKRNKRLKENQKKQKAVTENNTESNIKETTKTQENSNKSSRNVSTESNNFTQSLESCASSALEGHEKAGEGSDKTAESTATSNIKNENNYSSQFYDNPKLSKSEQIAYEILGIESTDGNELLFLNSSVSGYEEDICFSPTQDDPKTNDILFGDFSQENPPQENSAQTSDELREENDDTSEDFSVTISKVVKNYTYTLQELKTFANEPASKIPPAFRNEVYDIIGKNLRGEGGTAPAQMYQQISFKDSLNYLNRKRNKRANDVPPYQQQFEQQQRNADIIRINLSLNEEIQLAKSENAWVPAGLKNRSSNAESEDDEQILKKIRGILNKLTPENFDKLLQSAANFHMAGKERMKKVMLLIFEKTVSEPNFAPTYARFCKFLFNPQNENHKMFKTILIQRIQEEFEGNVNNAKAKNAKLRPLMDKLAIAKDPKEKLELKAELDDQEYQFRRRAWGTVRFIGEMFKLGFLATERVCSCIENLLDPRCEEKLEYMCKLLTTVGAQLEPVTDKQQTGVGEEPKISERLDTTFITVKQLVQKKKPAGQKISSRVRFMMQDVVELRARSWDQKGVPTLLPSRDASPALSSGPPTSQRELRIGSSYMPSGGYEKRKQPGDRQKSCSPGNIDVSKLPVFSAVEPTRNLGNSSPLMWKTVGRPQQQTVPLTLQPTNVIRTPQPDAKEPITPRREELSSCECERLLNGLIEVTIEEESKNEWFAKWKEIPTTHHPAIIYYLLTEYLHSAKVKRPEINACSRLFTNLMKESLLTRSSFTEGYQKFSEVWDDILVDVPKGWQYVFSFLGPLLHLELIPFDLIWDKTWANTAGGDKFLQSMIIHFTSEFGANYMRYFWDCNSLRWDKFMPDERVAPFITANRFEFIENIRCVPPIFIQRTPDELVHHIKALLQQSDQNVDLIIDFITTNVYIGSSFIRNLTMFLCDYTVFYNNTPNSSSRSNSRKKSKLSDSPPSTITPTSPSYKLQKDLFVTKCIPLLRLCIDSKDERELSCLDAIVWRCKQLYDSSADDLICSILTELYGEVISKESFEKWHQQQQLLTEGDNKLTSDFNAFFDKLTI